MKKLCEKQKCTGCMACYNICPQKAINMDIYKGFLYPIINGNCIDCGQCYAVCPANCNVSKQEPINKIAYAVFNKSKKIRDSSSSGGVFYSLAEWVINNHGNVYGAAWTNDLKVNHIKVDINENIKLLQGSKYVQSYIGSVYGDIKKDLIAGKSVMFSGVPCQIAALKSYLKKDYDKLYTCEVLCHGAASPKVFAEHIKYIEKVFNSKIQKVNFRYKTREGCQNIEYIFENGTSTIINNPLDDFYYNGFLNGALLRNSCFSCKFIGVERCADITLADFWGIQKDAIQLPDSISYPSLVFINTERGQRVWDITQNNFLYVERPLMEAVWGNLSLRRAIPRNKWGEKFFVEYEDSGYQSAAKHCLKQHINAKGVIKKIIGENATNLLIRILKR